MRIGPYAVELRASTDRKGFDWFLGEHVLGGIVGVAHGWSYTAEGAQRAARKAAKRAEAEA